MGCSGPQTAPSKETVQQSLKQPSSKQQSPKPHLSKQQATPQKPPTKSPTTQADTTKGLHDGQMRNIPIQKPSPQFAAVKSNPGSPKRATAPKAKLSPAPKLELSTTEQKWVSKVEQEVQTKASVAKQDVGQTYLGHVLRSQQATRLVSGSFTGDLQELIADAPTQNSDYQLQILEANQQKAVVVAAAKQSGNFSYIGAVYAQATNLPVATICKSNEPTKKPPGAPKLMGADLVCAQGSTAVQ